MNSILKHTVTLVALLAFGASALASENKMIAPTVALSRGPVSPPAPAIVRSSTPMNSVELAKYQNLSVQSQDLASGKAAGASDTTKTVLIVVAVVGVAAAVLYHNSAASGIGPINIGSF